MKLDLIHRWLDSGISDELLEVVDCQVGNSDILDLDPRTRSANKSCQNYVTRPIGSEIMHLASCDQLVQRAPCVSDCHRPVDFRGTRIGFRERDGPMHHCFRK